MSPSSNTNSGDNGDVIPGSSQWRKLQRIGQLITSTSNENSSSLAATARTSACSKATGSRNPLGDATNYSSCINDSTTVGISSATANNNTTENDDTRATDHQVTDSESTDQQASDTHSIRANAEATADQIVAPESTTASHPGANLPHNDFTRSILFGGIDDALGAHSASELEDKLREAEDKLHSQRLELEEVTKALHRERLERLQELKREAEEKNKVTALVESLTKKAQDLLSEIATLRGLLQERYEQIAVREIILAARGDLNAKVKLQFKQRRLLALYHAEQCRCEDGKCSVLHGTECAEYKRLLVHITQCRSVAGICSAAHCNSSSELLSHHTNCKNQHCLICAPLRIAIRGELLPHLANCNIQQCLICIPLRVVVYCSTAATKPFSSTGKGELMRDVLIPRENPSDPDSIFDINVHQTKTGGENKPHQIGIFNCTALSNDCDRALAFGIVPMLLKAKDIVVSINGTVVFDVSAKKVVIGFTGAVDLMRATPRGHAMKIDVLRINEANTSASAAEGAVVARLQEKDSSSTAQLQRCAVIAPPATTAAATGHTVSAITAGRKRPSGASLPTNSATTSSALSLEPSFKKQRRGSGGDGRQQSDSDDTIQDMCGQQSQAESSKSDEKTPTCASHGDSTDSIVTVGVLTCSTCTSSTKPMSLCFSCLRLNLELLSHAATCTDVVCPWKGCGGMKLRLNHVESCQVGFAGGCQACRFTWKLLKLHANQCNQAKPCPVPRCMEIKNCVNCSTEVPTASGTLCSNTLCSACDKPMQDLLLHSLSCAANECQVPECARMKHHLEHWTDCEVRAAGGCTNCKRTWATLRAHARSCERNPCQVPSCERLR